MKDWLSSSWEANWRSFQYFNLYRLMLSGLSLFAIFLPHPSADPFRLAVSPNLRGEGVAYLLIQAVGLFFSLRRQRHFNLQLSLQVSADVLAVSLFMFAAGGVTSGLGVILLVLLASASLVGRGHLVLFYAAQATIAILGMQIYGVWAGDFDSGSIVQAGFLSAGFFATAILARLLGQRVMFNEDLARRRGIALANQQNINQRVLERMQDGVLVIDRQGSVSRHNPVAVLMLDADVKEAMDLSIFAPELAVSLADWRAQAGPAAVDVPGREGHRLRARFESTYSSDGEALIFLEDIGRIEARAQELKLASLGRLTANIAHEIRNPLSSIGHAAELLREERRVEIQARLLRILGDNVVRLDRIVEDVLSLGRQTHAQPESIDLPEFLHLFFEGFSWPDRVDARVVRLESPAHCAFCFDRAHLHQILWNLLNNALRYSQQAAGSIALRVLEVGGRVELHVVDDGPGVPVEISAQIFEPFFTTHAKGTGLGLFIARALSEANGASLSLESVGQGTGGHFVLRGKGCE